MKYNSKNVLVSFTFINKKGESKTVTFPFDEKYYHDLFDPSISEEQRNYVLLDYYREFCKERKIARREFRFGVDEDGNEIEPVDPNSESYLDQMIEDEIKKERHEKLMKLLNQLSDKQCRAMILIYIDGLKQEEAAKKLGISQQAISKLVNKAIENLEKMTGRKIK